MTWFEPSEAECRICGCDWNHGCFDRQTGMGCHWAEPDLCSVCFRRLETRRLLLGYALHVGGAALLAFALSYGLLLIAP